MIKDVKFLGLKSAVRLFRSTAAFSHSHDVYRGVTQCSGRAAYLAIHKKKSFMFSGAEGQKANKVFTSL